MSSRPRRDGLDHHYGWLVTRNNEPVAILEFEGIDDPLNLFRLVPLVQDQALLAAIVGPRPPDARIVYYNVRTREQVSDIEFNVCAYSDGLVSIRDFRT